MQRPKKKLLVIQVAALGYDFLRRHHGETWHDLRFSALRSVFPAVTCTVQASFRTGLRLSEHGMVANGIFCRDLRRAFFWEQSSALVCGQRLWEGFRRKGRRVAILFWQQSLCEAADIILSPAPIHKHGGGMIPSVYSRPPELYAQLCEKVKGRFQLSRYWGPMADESSSEWIARATAALLQKSSLVPHLCLTYLPALDYALQRHGPDAPRSAKALSRLLKQLRLLLDVAQNMGYEVLIFGDYAVGPVIGKPVLPNLVFRKTGLLQVRSVGGRLYADLHSSRAFALVDHEVAHVYVQNPSDVTAVRGALHALDGVERVLGSEEQRAEGLAHARSGDLILLANAGRWFAYAWWTQPKEAPDYAAHVDIHNKPGFDPCELFFGQFPWQTSLDLSRPRGSHGRNDDSRLAAWAATCDFGCPTTLIDLAAAVKRWLENA